MAKMEVSVPHNLGQDEARKRIDNFLAELKKQFGTQVSDVNESWSGNKGSFALKAMGMSLDGNITVNENNVTVDGSLPMMATPFKGTIESTIRENLQKVLS